MGTYEGRLLVEYLDGRRWVHRVDAADPFRWTGSIGTVTPPDGMITDFASIPHLLAAILPETGFGRRGRWGPAGVLHDWLYLSQTRPDGTPLTRKEADDVFQQAMRDKGVGRVFRGVIWGSVRLAGWIWWAWFRHRRSVDPLNAVMPSWRIFQAFWWAVTGR